MKKKAGLTITYPAPDGRPTAVATIEDDHLLRQAAHIAIAQAEQRAAAAAGKDPTMGRLQRTEVRRLRAALAILLPDVEPQMAGAA